MDLLFTQQRPASFLPLEPRTSYARGCNTVAPGSGSGQKRLSYREDPPGNSRKRPHGVLLGPGFPVFSPRSKLSSRNQASAASVPVPRPFEKCQRPLAYLTSLWPAELPLWDGTADACRIHQVAVHVYLCAIVLHLSLLNLLLIRAITRQGCGDGKLRFRRSYHRPPNLSCCTRHDQPVSIRVRVLAGVIEMRMMRSTSNDERQ